MKRLGPEAILKAKIEGQRRHYADYERYCATDGAEEIESAESYVLRAVARKAEQEVWGQVVEELENADNDSEDLDTYALRVYDIMEELKKLLEDK